MSAGAAVFMALSWATVLGWAGWSAWRVMRAGRRRSCPAVGGGGSNSTSTWYSSRSMVR